MFASTAAGQATKEREAGHQADPPPPAYELAVDLGFKEFGLGNYPEARARFLEAERVYPTASIARALGMVEYEMRHYQLAIDYLARALISDVHPLLADERTEVEHLVERARGYLAHYLILTQPTQTHLSLDGVPVHLGSDHSLTIQIGDHVLEAHADDYWPLKRQLHVMDQSNQIIDLRLQAVPKTQQESPPLYASGWFWAGTGAAVVAGVTIALVFALQPSPRNVPGATVTTDRTPTGAVILALGAR
ncbi:MAG: hypothetical protein RL701_1997 [Pseudomonadota bacterium]|jgi:tetratricopeptide (TPR) repeat protein